MDRNLDSHHFPFMSANTFNITVSKRRATTNLDLSWRRKWQLSYKDSFRCRDLREIKLVSENFAKCGPRETINTLNDNSGLYKWFKTVSLTKTRSKGRPQKTKLVEDLRAAVDEYEHIYVFSFENMRASIFKDIRLHFRESRYVFNQ